jgi:hydroxyacylglutathione hydrolase
MLIHTIDTPSLAAFSYIVVASDNRSCIVVDPVRLLEPLLQQLRNSQLHVKAIVETHVHADFVSGAYELKAALAEQPLIYCSAAGGKHWLPPYADREVYDGFNLSMPGIRLQAIHTPGHTPEHMSWMCYETLRSDTVPAAVFSGDFIFAGGVGRPDLLGEQEVEALTRSLYTSLFETIRLWPDSLIVYPAHGAGSLCGKGMSARLPTTLGYERATNPAFTALPFLEWSKTLNCGIARPPQAFNYIKSLNQKGPRLMSQFLQQKQFMQLEEMLSLPKDNLFILDLRTPELFARQHLPGAVNVPWSSAFSTWLCMAVPEKQSLWLVLPEGLPVVSVVEQLALVGYEDILGYSYQPDSNATLVELPTLTAAELAARDDLAILDVRTPNEWHAGHIANAQHLELAALAQELKGFSSGQPLAVVCGSGMRSSVAASLLKRAGVHTVYNVQGGMQGWMRAGLPVVR